MHRLQGDPALFDFAAARALPGTGIDADRFWTGLSAIVHERGPEKRALLARCDQLPAQIDAWQIGQPQPAAGS